MKTAAIVRQGFVLQVGSDIMRGNLCTVVETGEQFIAGLNPMGFPVTEKMVASDGHLFHDGLVSGNLYKTFKPLLVTTDNFETACKLNGMQPG